VSDFSTDDSWIILSNIEQSIKQKILTAGTPLSEWNIQINYGIKTGLNEAFIISGAKRAELINEDPKSAEIIRPILRGRDIKRYGYEFADLWLITTFPSRNYDINAFPAIKNYLLSFGIERLEQTGKIHYVNGQKIQARKKTNNKWFEMQDSISYWNEFSKQKIVWGEISDKPKFAIDIEGTYCPEATTFLMTGEHLKYLLCFLNSTLSEYYFAKYGTTTGMGTLRWKKYLIELLPVPRIDDKQEAVFEEALEQLLSGSVEQLEARQIIDSLIYQTLNLSKEEIIFIEQMVVQGAH